MVNGNSEGHVGSGCDPMIYADYTYGTNHSKRKAYKNIDSARRNAIAWCKEHKGQFVSFYKSQNSYRPFGSMAWFKGDAYASYFMLQGVDDRYFGKGVSEGGYEVKSDGKLRK